MKKFGLDFGTTNSAIAIEKDGEGMVLPIDDLASNPRVVRTMLYFPSRQIVYKKYIPEARIQNQVFMIGDFYYEGESDPLIGHAAVEQYLRENKDRKPGILRRIYTGRLINSRTLAIASAASSETVREYYEEIDYGTGRLMQALKTALKSSLYRGTTVFGEYYTLEKLIGTFVGEAKRKAEEIIGEEIDEVVCGRPVHFLDDPEKDRATQERLEEGLKLAGFKKVTFEYEPVGAAKQYIAESGKSAEKVFVFDFGGGTLDTAIVDATDGKVLAEDGVYIGGDLLNADIMRVKLWSYFGSTAIYGDTMQRVSPHLYEPLNSWYSIPNLNNPEMMNMLERIRYKHSNPASLDRYIHLIKANLGFDIYEAIERAKIQLSSSDSARIIFKDGPIDIDVEITCSEFEEIIKERVEEIRNIVLKTLETAKLTPDQVDVVVRTGGSSLIPVFENMLGDIFGRNKLKLFETFTSIASGLALYK